MLPSPHRPGMLARLRTYRENPALFAHECFTDSDSPSGRLELAPHQVDVLQRVAAGHDLTWRAGHGVGKTTTMAVLVFWWLVTHPYSKVATTAPTQRQVRNLWAEIARWYNRFLFRSYFDLQTARLAMKAHPAEWQAMGFSSNRAENVEGLHAKHLLAIVDEAKGVGDSIFDAIDGACTEGGRRVYVSTPGSRTGKFYDSHHGRVSRFFAIVHTNGETADRVSKAWIALKREEWGPTSPIYIAKVRGEFPSEGDDVMFPLDYLDEAVRAFEEIDADGLPAVRHASHYTIGCDVARFGFDKTVAVGGSARRLDRLSTWERTATTETTARLIALAREWGAPEGVGQAVELFAIDDTGLGGGVTDQLQEGGWPVEGVRFGAAPTEDGREYYANKKAEMAGAFRKALEANQKARQGGHAGTCALIPNERLLGQLAALRRRFKGAGVLSLVDPDDPSVPASELAKGMKVSPDHAHAAILAYYGATQATAVGVGAVLRPPGTRGTPGRDPRRLSRYIFGRPRE